MATDVTRCSEKDKVKLMLAYARKFRLKIFVETGTYTGYTPDRLAKWFDHLFTIEIDQQRYLDVLPKLLPHGNVFPLLGDSAVVLPKLLEFIQRPALFWIDAHVGEARVAAGEEVPIRTELGALMLRPYRDVILIDDARLCGQGDFPRLDTIQKAVQNLKPDWVCEMRDDIIRIHRS